MTYFETIVIYDGKYAGRKLDVEVEVTLRGTKQEVAVAKKQLEQTLDNYFKGKKGKRFTYSTGVVRRGQTDKKFGHSKIEVSGHRGTLRNELTEELHDTYDTIRRVRKKRKAKK